MLNSWFVFLVLISRIQNPRPDSDVCEFPNHQEGKYGWTLEIKILSYFISNVWTNSRELSKPFASLLTCWGVSLRTCCDEAHLFSVFLSIQGKPTTFKPWPLSKIANNQKVPRQNNIYNHCHCARAIHKGESGPLTHMFMLRFKTLSARDRHWRSVESATIPIQRLSATSAEMGFYRKLLGKIN